MKRNLIILGRVPEVHITAICTLQDFYSLKFAHSISEVTIADVEEVEAIFLWDSSPSALQTILQKAKKLRWLHARYAGVDNLLIPELRASTVLFSNGRGVYAEALGEYVIAAMLYFAKDISRLIINKAAQRWDVFEMEMLHGKTLGVIGYGAIGKAIATRAAALGMEVCALRRNVKESLHDPLLTKVYGPTEVELLCGQSDYVAVSAALTKETRHLVGDSALRAMKRHAVLINVARGALIDHAALLNALREGAIRGAALDVFEDEPLPENDPLWQLPNVLVSSHCADRVPGWLDTAAESFVQHARAYAKGDPLPNLVDKHAGY